MALQCDEEGRVVCPQSNLDLFSFGESRSSCSGFILKRCHPQQRTLAQALTILWSFVASRRDVLSFPQRFRSRFNRSSRFVKVINAGVVQQKAPLQRPVYLALSS